MRGGGFEPSVSEADLHRFVDGELDVDRQAAGLFLQRSQRKPRA
jgi:hypothetical protein